MSAYIPVLAFRAKIENGSPFIGATQLLLFKVRGGIVALRTRVLYRGPGLNVIGVDGLDVATLLAERRGKCRWFRSRDNRGGPTISS